MKFEEGRILDRILLQNGKEVVIRFPKRSDAKGFLIFINSIIGEKAKIMLNKKISFGEEKKWLKDTLNKSRKGKTIHICAESDGNIVSSMGLQVGEGARHKTAVFGLSVSRSYRRFGIATRMFFVIEDLARERGLEILESSYYSNNKASGKLHEKLGFREAGTIPKAVDYYGKRVDEIIAYKMLK